MSMHTHFPALASPANDPTVTAQEPAAAAPSGNGSVPHLRLVERPYTGQFAAPSPDGPDCLLAALWRCSPLQHQMATLDRRSGEFRNTVVEDIAGALALAKRASDAGKDVYHACAEYGTPDSRKASNASSASALWMDLDCGAEKAAKRQGYDDIPTARAALDAFCTCTGLPLPTHVVNSGGGLHPYWVLCRPLEREAWLVLARKLKAVAGSCGLLADPSRTADIASVLRMPGTLNHKYEPPRPVVLESAAAAIDCDLMCTRIDDAYERFSAITAPVDVVSAKNVHGDLKTGVSSYGAPDLAELGEALAYLEPDCDERTWKLRRLAPLAHAASMYRDRAGALYDLAKKWSSGELRGKPAAAWTTVGSRGITGAVAFEREWVRFSSDRYDGHRATLGTIFHDAKEAGWKAAASEPLLPTVLADCLARAEPARALHVLKPLDPAAFPHRGQRTPPTTIENVEYLLSGYGSTARYNVIKKKLQINVPGHSGSADNYDNVTMTKVLSLAILNGMNVAHIPNMVAAVADRNQFNPAADWIALRPWDGVNRAEAFYATLVEREPFPRQLKEALMYRWLLSAVAAALMPSGFSCRGVLTLQGPQGIGKTRWTSALISDPSLAKELIKLDHLLDPGDKDSRLGAITHWIVEIGELDGSLRKADIARLKGFFTSNQDKIRRPYAGVEAEYPRRTVFCATVNDANFLVDPTGNTRFWTVPVASVDYQHGINMQQVFAQLAVDYANGQQWWLTPEEERQLEQANKAHRTVSATWERVLDELDLNRIGDDALSPMTATEMLKRIGVQNPTATQARECGAVLREYLGEPKRSQGRDRWRVPLREVDTSGFYRL